MLLLRHIHITRREQLAAERKQLLIEMAASHGEAWETRQNVSKMAKLTSALTGNAAQDYQIDAEVQCAALRGVSKHSMLHHQLYLSDLLRCTLYDKILLVSKQCCNDCQELTCPVLCPSRLLLCLHLRLEVQQ